MPLYVPGILESKARSDVEHVTRFRDSIHLTYENERRQLDARAARHRHDDDYADVLADEAYLLDEICQLGDQMSIVALYRVVELNTILALRWRWPDAEERGLYRINNLEQQLRSHLGTDLHSLQGFSVVNELRCANNAVKHEGKVTAALAAFPGWTQGAHLGGVRELFNRAVSAIPSYLRALAEVVIPGQTSNG